jgi:hypothetical protein
VVIQNLLDEMQVTVRSYHETVLRTPETVPALIQGTAFFPGGSGLWRGGEPFGELPEFFPAFPVMFVGHNFDSSRAFSRSLEMGGECNSEFWRRLRTMLESASLPPEQCFY